MAATARTSGAANAVNIIFRHVRQLVVDHVRQLTNIQSTCGDIRCHQNAHFASFKLSECPCACSLRFVAVNCCRLQIIFVELLSKTVGAVLGACKHQHLLPSSISNEIGQQIAFARTIHRVHDLRHHFRSGVAACNLHLFGAMQQIAG